MGSSAGLRGPLAAAEGLPAFRRFADTVAAAGLPGQILRALETLHYQVEAIPESGALLGPRVLGPHVLAAIIGDEAGDAASLCASLPSAIPKILLTRDHSFEVRRAAARAGVEAVIGPPAPLAQILDWLDLIEARHRVRRPSVLLIADDPVVARDYGAGLLRAGLEASIAGGPAAALQALEHGLPDLIVIDIQHPVPGGVENGFELAAMIRQSRDCLQVPAVFLGSGGETPSPPAPLAPGQDRCLCRPDCAGDLARDIWPLAEGARAWRDQIERDPLTHLYHHASFDARGAAELARSRRGGGTCSLALVAVDRFKDINARFGRVAGDRVLKTLARLFRGRLRSSDLTGRIGGAEFAVLFPATDPRCARHVLQSLQADFAQIVFEENAAAFSASFRFATGGSQGLSWSRMWASVQEALETGQGRDLA